jgi:hypothetical protein
MIPGMTDRTAGIAGFLARHPSWLRWQRRVMWASGGSPSRAASRSASRNDLLEQDSNSLGRHEAQLSQEFRSVEHKPEA